MIRRRSLLAWVLCIATAASAWGHTAPVTTTIVVTTSHRGRLRAHARERERRAPHRLVSCAKSGAGPTSAYNLASGVSFQGWVEKVLVSPDRTVLVIRDGAGETCAFLPPEPELALHGIVPDMLIRRTPVLVEGFPNRMDRRKVLVEQLAINPRR